MIDLRALKKKQTLDPFRYEVKIPLDRVQAEDFIPVLYQLGLYPKTPFPDRRINSVYYDTVNFTDYDDNISGIGSRRKTRLRWYNGDLSRLTLEQKIKNNKASRKEHIKLENQSQARPQTTRGVQDILAQNERPRAKAILANLRPALEVQYDRQYYTLGPELRMTIDKNQMFKRLHPSPTVRSVVSPVYAVVEFKYPATQRTKMQSVLRNLPYRVFRHSKYVIGLESTYI